MGDKYYSAIRAKKSLIHFAFGKLLSACLSIAYLALTVRYMNIADYGAYIVILASLDVFYLTTGFGLSTIAQRYVTEYKTKASSTCLRAFLNRLFLQRIVHSLFFAFVLLIAHQWFAALVGVSLADTGYYWVALWLVVAASGYFLDEILGSLLLQGLFQGISVGKVFIKLVLVSILIWGSVNVSIEYMLIIECVTSTLAIIVGHVLLSFHLKNDQNETARNDNYHNPGMWPAARKFYLVQLIGQLYGPNISRMLISRYLGLLQAAVFGFAQSVTDMLRNFLPAHLLSGWLRPLMISRYLVRRDLNDLADVANLILKLNMLGIVPLAAFFFFRGDAFGALISNGKYSHAGNLFTLLTIMVGLQTVHLLFSMITITLEQPNANIVATFLAAVSLPFSIFLIWEYGVEGAAIGLLSSEFVWLVAASLLLARKNVVLVWDFKGSLRLIIAGVVSGLVMSFGGFEQATLLDISVSAIILGVSFLAFSMLAKPLRAQERALVAQIVPAKFIIW
ncbi:MAG: hypothetical protein HGA71_11795 [Azonexaceae bacterium]|nr:hypothetical protein [Azonexaceae bacterium]